MAQIITTLPTPDTEGFTPTCLTCPEPLPAWPTRIEAQDAAVWHVFDAHPEHWRAVIGNRPPMRPRPRKEP